MNASLGIRVLVVEDNDDHLFLTVRALRDRHGDAVVVEAVHDGEEALEYMRGLGRFAGRARPHLVLLDLKMPKVGGLEVLEQVKADPDLHMIPVVVLSSSDRPEDIVEAYRRGGNSYVTKPVTASGLRAGLDELSDYWLDLARLPGLAGT